MKNSFQKFSMIMAMLALVMIVIGTSSCKKSSSTTTTTPTIVLDGFYVKGAVAAYSDYNAKAMMKTTPNEVTQTARLHLMELYIPLKAGAAGFNIVKVAGSVKTIYGPGTGFGVVATPTTDEPKVAFQRGPATTTNPGVFTVPADGFYHVVIDDSLNKVAIMRVHWGMIGAATPGGWSNDTMMTESAFNGTDMSWTLTGFKLMKGDWKLRYSHGWKVEIDTNVVLGASKGVKVNTNFGGTIAALVPGGANIVNAAPGIYTITFAYKLGTGYTLTATKTGDIPPIDYSQYQMDIIGDAYLKQDGTPAAWDESYGKTLPTISGTTYTWTYNITFIDGKDFKFRQGDDWAGKSVGFPDVVMAGGAAANFANDGGNFKVTGAGAYTMVLKIEAATETYTVTATKN